MVARARRARTAPTSAAPARTSARASSCSRPAPCSGPAALGVLASIGHTTVRCAAAPRVALLATGDELTAPGRAAARRAGSTAPTARRWPRWSRTPAGGWCWPRTCPTPPEGTRSALGRAHGGRRRGVRVGRACPWAPTTTSRARSPTRAWRSASGAWRSSPASRRGSARPGPKLGFGLPGNPVSALVTFLLFARPALLALQGADPRSPADHRPPDRARRRPRRAGPTPCAACCAPAPTAGSYADGPAGLAPADLDAGRGGAGADRAGRGRAAGRDPVAPSCSREYRLRTVRKRDPRRVIGRRREARARVKIIDVPASEARRRTAA